MGVLLSALRSVDFLQGSPEDVVEQFLLAGRCADHPKAHSLWRVGSQPEGLVVAVTGEAKTTQHGAEGREFIERFVGPGEWLGLQSTLDGLPHPTSAEVSKTGTFFHMQRVAFLAFLDRHPDIRQRAITALGRLYRRSVQDREDMALRPVGQRVAQFLIDHACVRQADGAKVLIHVTQAEIAARLGTVREVVARTLAEFSAQRLIERTDTGIFIENWSGLHAAAAIDLPHGRDAPSASGPPSPDVRTARFYLPRSESWSKRSLPETTGCREHLGDLETCERNGCPAAREDAEKRRRSAGRKNG